VALFPHGCSDFTRSGSLGQSAAPALMSLDDCIGHLCLRCGICCNGILFGDVRIPDPAEARQLEAARLPLRGKTQGRSVCACLPQPCPALGKGNLCAVYRDRPTRCRQFECALLKQAVAGAIALPQAVRVIRETLARAQRVSALLEALGNHRSDRSLARRFRALQRALPRRALTEDSASLFADLTLQVHDLNLSLRRHFYPGD